MSSHQPASGGRAHAEARHVAFGNAPHEQHRMQIDQARADGAGLRVVADLERRVLDHSREGRAHLRAFHVQHRRFALRFGSRQPRLRLGDGRLGIEAPVAQAQAAFVLDARLLDGGLGLGEPRLAVFHGEAAEQVSFGDPGAAFERPLDDPAAGFGADVDGALVLGSAAHRDALRQRHRVDDPPAHRGRRHVPHRRPRKFVGLGQARMLTGAFAGRQRAGREPQDRRQGDDGGGDVGLSHGRPAPCGKCYLK